MPATSAATASESTSVASTKTEIARSRLAPISEKPFATSQAAAASGEPRQREQPGQRERVVPKSPVGREPRGRDEQHGGGGARRDHRRREPVDGRRSLDGDGALAPEAAQLAVGLERRRPAATLQPRLPVLDEAGQQRREQHAADHLRGARRDRRGAHPITPTRAAARSTTTSAIR